MDQETNEVLEDQPQASKTKKKMSKRKKLTVLGVAVVVVAAAGAGMFVWHEQPSFCTAICHTSMTDGYLSTYEATPGEPSVDKWGNQVADARSMLSCAHQAYGDLTCMSCHNAEMLEQVSEGIEVVTGDYVHPLTERDEDDLVYYRGSNITQLFTGYSGTESKGEEFCLNASCHNMSDDDLVNATKGYPTNPHEWYTSTDGAQCTDCHKGHRASVMACDGNDDCLPQGWITKAEEAQLATTQPEFERK